jgi:hypothetical protein
MYRNFASGLKLRVQLAVGEIASKYFFESTVSETAPSAVQKTSLEVNRAVGPQVSLSV